MRRGAKGKGINRHRGGFRVPPCVGRGRCPTATHSRPASTHPKANKYKWLTALLATSAAASRERSCRRATRSCASSAQTHSRPTMMPPHSPAGDDTTVKALQKEATAHAQGQASEQQNTSATARQPLETFGHASVGASALHKRREKRLCPGCCRCRSYNHHCCHGQDANRSSRLRRSCASTLAQHRRRRRTSNSARRRRGQG